MLFLVSDAHFTSSVEVREGSARLACQQSLLPKLAADKNHYGLGCLHHPVEAHVSGFRVIATCHREENLKGRAC